MAAAEAGSEEALSSAAVVLWQMAAAEAGSEEALSSAAVVLWTDGGC